MNKTADRNMTQQASNAYLEAGICHVPIKCDGSKSPAVPWADLQTRMTTKAEGEKWFGRLNPYGIATVHGKVSGNLEMLDFDIHAEETFPQWCELVEAECPGLVAKINVVQTPREPEGKHCRYRCIEVTIPGNMKLAEEIHLDEKSGKTKRRTLIETRGEGGYAIAPGSPPEVHENKRLYVHVSGPALSKVQTITAAEREVLLRCAASFNKDTPPEPKTRHKSGSASDSVRVGDDFNTRGPGWSELLEPYGWKRLRSFGGRDYWQRPDKDGPGWSATTGGYTNSQSHEYFSVFSSNADPFPGPSSGRICSCHTKFAVYAMLQHGGDFSAATKQLAGEGFGEQKAIGHHGSNGQGKAKPAASGSATFPLGSLVLVPGQPRLMPSGKLSLAINAMRGGNIVFPFMVSSAISSRQDPIRVLRQHLDDGFPEVDIDKALTAALAHGASVLASRKAPEGPTVREIVSSKATEAFQLACRTKQGAWSEARGGEISRSDFVTNIPSYLVDECGKAIDAPKDANGAVMRADLIRQIQIELGVCWSDLMATLPPQEGIDLGAKTAAGRAFHHAMVRLWTRTQTFEIVKAKEVTSGEVASRASIISRVRTQGKDYLNGDVRPQAREAWRPVQYAFDAWWRPHEDKDGHVHLLLAMRWRLMEQAGVELPGVNDQVSLTRLGKQFGVLTDPPPGVSAVFDRGKFRLAVLASALAEELLEQPMDDEKAEKAAEKAAEDAREPGQEG